MATLLEFSQVNKTFDGHRAVRDLSFTINDGEFIAIMGPSGCGKTTTLRMIAGFDVPDSGEIKFDNNRLNDLKPWQRKLPMVWQSLALFPFLTVVQNVEFGLKMQQVLATERHKRAMEWLERLQIAQFADTSVEKLSGGQRQRVALARTLVLEPKILLLDEPLSALDANMVAHMQETLTQLQKQIGITFLYVTHSRHEAFAMADRIIVMNNGQLAQCGTPAQIYRRPQNRFVAEFIGETNLLSGKITHNDNVYQLETADGVLPINNVNNANQTHLTAGAPAAISVNECDLNVGNEPNTAFDSTLKCRLEEESYMGDFIRLRLRTTAGTVVRAKINIGEQWQPGRYADKNLYAQWHSKNAHFLTNLD